MKNLIDFNDNESYKVKTDLNTKVLFLNELIEIK